jgi:phospholipase C
MNGAEFIDRQGQAAAGYVEPQGNLKEHAGYSEVLSATQHLADLIAPLETGPQWPHMLVVVTYDENGGFWGHAAPPKADRWGPDTRIPAIICAARNCLSSARRSDRGAESAALTALIDFSLQRRKGRFRLGGAPSVVCSSAS